MKQRMNTNSGRVSLLPSKIELTRTFRSIRHLLLFFLLTRLQIQQHPSLYFPFASMRCIGTLHFGHSGGPGRIPWSIRLLTKTIPTQILQVKYKQHTNMIHKLSLHKITQVNHIIIHRKKHAKLSTNNTYKITQV